MTARSDEGRPPPEGAVPTGAQVAWMKVWASLRDHPKWIPLSLELRGAWVTLALIVCAAQPNRGEIASRAHAVALLEREAPGCDADALIDALIDAGLIDELPGGRIGFHDWAVWQTRHPSDHPDAVRDRVRRSRAAKGDVTTPGVVTGRDVTTIDRETPSRGVALSSERAEGASLDELEDDEVDLELVRALMGPAVEDEDPAWLAAVASAALAKLDPALSDDERSRLRALAVVGTPA